MPAAVAAALAVIAARHGFAVAAALGAAALATRARTRPAACGVLFGVAIALVRPDASQAVAEHVVARLPITITGDVRHDEAGTQTVVRSTDGRRFRARFAGGEHLTPGDRLVVRARLVPFDVARNPGEPSERALARDEGLAATLFVSAVLDRAPPEAHDASSWSARARAWAAARLRAHVREPDASVLAGALWGERGSLPSALHDEFRVTGTVHVLVTAGLHLGIVAGLVLGALWLAAVPRAAGAAVTAVVLVVYTWFSGAHIPSQRACAMALVVLLARGLGARARPGDALAVAALAVLAVDPGSVESVSFGLSFSCVTAIACFGEPIAHALQRARVPHRMREPLTLTIATQLGVWPLSAAIFGTLAPYAIVANAIVVPAIGVAMPLGMLVIACTPLPLLCGITAAWATWTLAMLRAVVHFTAMLPGARMTMPPPPVWSVLAYDALALVAALWLRRERVRLALVTLAAAAVVVVGAAQPRPTRVATILALDVGQGDGFVIETPGGHVVLIDAGGRLERGPSVGGASPAERVGERVVLGYLRRRGVARVDLLVVTHPHGDHVGGCAPIVAALRVDAILDTAQPYGGRAYTDCMRIARERRVAVRIARAGERWTSGDGLTLEVLSPWLPLLADTGDDVNENSAIVRATYDDGRGAEPVRALFTGDAGGASEARLLDSGVDLRADILKVGHHGSRYASTPDFIAAVRPSLAVISVGRHNLFGHPAPATVDGLKAAGAAIWRTDRCGAITIAMQRPPVATPMIAGCDLPRRPRMQADFQPTSGSVVVGVIGRAGPNSFQFLERAPMKEAQRELAVGAGTILHPHQ